MENKTTCSKCKGKGILIDYTHIQGGKCFACNGKGYILNDELVTYFQMSAIDLEDNQRKAILWVKAKNEKEAIRKAKKLKSKIIDWNDPQVEQIEKRLR